MTDFVTLYNKLFENLTVNWCAKIACCLSGLIFTFLYVNSSIKIAEKVVPLVRLPFVNFALHPTQRQKSNGVRCGDLGGHISIIIHNSTYVHMNCFSQNARYCHLPKSFLLNHPVFSNI